MARVEAIQPLHRERSCAACSALDQDSVLVAVQLRAWTERHRRKLHPWPRRLPKGRFKSAAVAAKSLVFLRLANAAIPIVQEAGFGRIVGISGQNSYLTGSITGAARNAALIVVAKNPAGTGVLVNTVNPGGVTAVPSADVQIERAGESTPQQIADIVALLASPLAATSGESIAVGHRVRGAGASLSAGPAAAIVQAPNVGVLRLVAIEAADVLRRIGRILFENPSVEAQHAPKSSFHVRLPPLSSRAECARSHATRRSSLRQRAPFPRKLLGVITDWQPLGDVTAKLPAAGDDVGWHRYATDHKTLCTTDVCTRVDSALSKDLFFGILLAPGSAGRVAIMGSDLNLDEFVEKSLEQDFCTEVLAHRWKKGRHGRSLEPGSGEPGADKSACVILIVR